jgi:hypothetical protein
LNPGSLPTGAILADDAQGHTVILFPGDWALRSFEESHPSVVLGTIPFENGRA